MAKHREIEIMDTLEWCLLHSLQLHKRSIESEELKTYPIPPKMDASIVNGIKALSELRKAGFGKETDESQAVLLLRAMAAKLPLGSPERVRLVELLRAEVSEDNPIIDSVE